MYQSLWEYPEVSKLFSYCTVHRMIKILCILNLKYNAKSNYIEVLEFKIQDLKQS